MDWKALGYHLFCVVELKVEAEKEKEAGHILTQVPNLWNVCKLIDPTNEREVTFRMWTVTDSHHTMLSIMGNLLEEYDGFCDAQVQVIDMLSRNPGVVNVGRVLLNEDTPLWTLPKGE